MLAFIDESGDPGLSGRPGSSSCFVVALVVFDNQEDADAADTRVSRLRAELRLDPRYEFRFSKMHNERRRRFLIALNREEFRYYAVVADKRVLGSNVVGGPALVQQALHTLLDHAEAKLNEATLILDGTGSREHQRRLGHDIRSYANRAATRVRAVKIQDSHRNNLLQLADSIAGAVARAYSAAGETPDFRSLVRRHEETIVGL